MDAFQNREMNIITAIPDGIFSMSWHFEEEGKTVATLKMPLMAWKLRGTITLSDTGEIFEMEQIKILNRSMAMKDQQGLVCATAEISGFFSTTYTVRFNQRVLRLKKVFFSARTVFDILDEDREIGKIRQPRLLSRQMTIETSPDADIPREALLFMLWIGMMVRHSESSDSSMDANMNAGTM